MSFSIKPRVWEILACPFCGKPLTQSANGAYCKACDHEYQFLPEGPLDLGLKKTKSYSLQFDVNPDPNLAANSAIKLLPLNSFPEVDFSIRRWKIHNMSKELISYFPQAKREGALMLDLGCGTAIHREMCEQAGFEYIGFELASPRAQIRGDAQALPFQSNSLEFILSIAVLQYIRYPFIMMREVSRVLQPGGKFIGSVAFLEPYTTNAYYHQTHLGVYSLLKQADFNIESVAPSPDWTVLTAQARMELFFKLPFLCSKMLVLPLDLLHRFWWKLGCVFSGSERFGETYRLLSTTGSITFIATKK